MYKDLNPTLQRHPDTHDITVRTGISAINGSLINLILTNKYERPYNPTLAGDVYRLLFEDCNDQTAGVLQTTIEAVINNFEPRVTNVNVLVGVNSTNDGYIVQVSYTGIEDRKQGSFILPVSKNS